MSERTGETTGAPSPQPIAGTDRRPNSYWYDERTENGARQVLEAVRRLRRADQAMRHRSERYMRLNATDMEALRLIVARERCGVATTPGDVTAHLDVTSAATTKLLGRLEAAGFVTRSRNPLDGRGQLLQSTEAAHREVRRSLGDMHARMIGLAAALDDDQQRAVIGFLDALVELFDGGKHVDGPNEAVDHDATAR
ncbi:MarR family winged helix-turn-helix transcriptional regulator [Pseudoclavibacter sp. 13-3]|uniref:MarR family winged helix-turn-helix transcriptional regulator n=1 Tax=Pseudoclavibacter sp. 13-3 TaxID=2901228 RepID=UPI001E5ACB92|nr:MarR family winged helix-turn-helix transcriptional regulator [Pseudoclavibacter sp. 13-3]MCD7101049.1 MarR family winged helix-turn-helix transcriptional regulator [Pseudoclavibacter sp. 13-3]